MKTTSLDRQGPLGSFNQGFNGRNSDRAMLAGIARRAMIERGLEPEFPSEHCMNWHQSISRRMRLKTCETCGTVYGLPLTMMTPAILTS
jgi:hypothetical protein